MSTKYCPQCGKASSASANFCEGCGSSLNSLSKSSTPTKTVNTFTPFLAGGDDEDDDDSYLDRIQRLDIKIDKLELEINQSRIPKETVGTVYSQGGKYNSSENREANPTVDMKKFLEEYSKEGSNSPRNNEK